jgi:inosine/xanthosine triphosphate pyrophosphatase family protein
VPEHQRASAELDAVLKNRISHRSQALRSLALALMGSREFQKIAG